MTDFSKFMVRHSLTVPDIRDRFGIPYRTVQNWALPEEDPNHRSCPDYVLRMMEEIVEKTE